MGNSLQGVSLLSIKDFDNYHLRLGSHASISVTKKDYTQKDVVKGLPQFVKEWNVSYTVERSNCELSLYCYFSDSSPIVKNVDFYFTDDLLPHSYMLPIYKTKTYMVKLRPPLSAIDVFPERTVRSALDSIIETDILLYGKRSKGGLIVVESKKKSGDEDPYLVTVAHYYASHPGDFFNYKKTSTGFSVITKVQASNDTGLDITVVEGPTQHPAPALFHMFEEVRKTGTWKPTSCPHCANIQKQRVAGHGMSSQSDSEDSNNLLLPPRLHAPNQNVGSTTNNNGRFKGNFTGSFVKVRRGVFF